MNRRSSFFRKVMYGVAIAVLLFPLSYLSAPATVDSQGGVLAKLRAENGLSQAGLGEIDPASETIKLATLGLRGVAVQFLWDRANHFKKVEDWTNLTATLEQLAKLQPNFITFWKFQSWNLSYNVSTEFDDYNDRYYWVRRGIEFMQDGVDYNRDNPHLLWELGWMVGQKIGRADERVQYRRLFKADDEFHPEDRPPAERDNWLVSRATYLDSVAAVDERGKSLDKKSPSIFYSSAAKSQMNYAEAIENEGLFDTAVAAWKKAGEEWREFGNVPIEHSTGKILVFNEEQRLEEDVERLTEELEGLVDGAKEQVLEDQRALLSPEQAAALEVDPSDRTSTEAELAYQANRLLDVTPGLLAAKVAKLAPEKSRQARELAAEIADKKLIVRYTDNYKDTTNYDYWALRCEFEQSTEAVAARELIYRAQRLFKEEADPFAAKDLYEESFGRWAEVFEKFPKLKEGDDTTGDDVMVFIYEYNRVLEQLDEEMPEDFPLWEIIENFDSEGVFSVEVRERLQARFDAGGDDAQPTESAPDESPEADQEDGGTPPSDPADESESADSEEGAAEPEADPAVGEDSVEPAEDQPANDQAGEVT